MSRELAKGPQTTKRITLSTLALFGTLAVNACAAKSEPAPSTNICGLEFTPPRYSGHKIIYYDASPSERDPSNPAYSSYEGVDYTTNTSFVDLRRNGVVEEVFNGAVYPIWDDPTGNLTMLCYGRDRRNHKAVFNVQSDVLTVGSDTYQP